MYTVIRSLLLLTPLETIGYVVLPRYWRPTGMARRGQRMPATRKEGKIQPMDSWITCEIQTQILILLLFKLFTGITGATDTVLVPSTGTATEVGALTSSPPGRGQSSGGALWTPAYTPGDGQTSWVYSNNPVQYLYISCYVTVNKPVLSYLLLRLLPHEHCCFLSCN
jgi:hypothetical protein